MNGSGKRNYAVIGLIALGLSFFMLVYIIVPFFARDTYNIGGVAATNSVEAETLKKLPEPEVVDEVEVEKVSHVSIPKAVKTIYMSSCVAGTRNFRNDLVKIADETEINSIIIDIKDYTGLLSFKPEDPMLADFVSDRCSVSDMKEFIKTLHDKNIYVIGRITVFQDPHYAKLYPELAVKRASDGGIWADQKGIHYLDPGSQKAWDHIVAISNASYAIGFDELNYDYIRFPSDGNMKDIAFPFSQNKPKQEVLESFFSYLHDKMKPTGVVTSADLFGMTTNNTDDLNIGQILERAMPYFDYIAPMVYPSHYPATFNGWKNPNDYPGELIKYVMDAAVQRTIATSSIFNIKGSTPIASTSPQLYTKPAYDKNKMRPWLQDFDYGGDYDVKEVKAQIEATYAAGLNSWMLWAPSNRYTQGALLPE